MPKLSFAMQHYIQTIYELSNDGEGVRVSDIAAKRSVSKSSACIAMKVLQKAGLIQRDNNRLVLLTAKGAMQAMVITNKISIIRQFLVDVLGIEQKNATEAARAMEHTISIETLCSFCKFHNNNGSSQVHCEGGGECHLVL